MEELLNQIHTMLANSYPSYKVSAAFKKLVSPTKGIIDVEVGAAAGRRGEFFRITVEVTDEKTMLEEWRPYKCFYCHLPIQRGDRCSCGRGWLVVEAHGDDH